ncbi:CRISPR-associated protein Cas4 [Deinococcus multiflagellatus]|uniref:CRISPR-associated exonuclease Cas4 n=1 Tax=Deinococcus multiflagellatus TaxID=1656887 RepID=A0ABW1ZSD1_9DEIO|nr:CRISPR-associated protein Cas4 [Deinococcus multiflagellatus]MBZ9713505.1 CRISPR-associated protein Cas4 [Deinococcus multiflagellatus]
MEEVMLSALQHFVFCPRQCALIHVEQVWAENEFTARGQQHHDRAHGGGTEERGGVRTLRALPLVSRQHGLAGVADVVEVLPGGSPRPVEYKSGRARPRLADEVQLCAQALCLEEMFGVSIPEGFIYHAASHKRRVVAFTPALRQAVLEARDGVRELLRRQTLPPPAADDRCLQCSLLDLCEPFAAREFPRGFDPFSTALEE